MKSNFLLALYGSCVLLLQSCQNQPTPTQTNSDTEFVGTWVLKTYEDELTVLQKSVGLDSSNYGFTIKEGGNFLERKNIGWCGTPPIVYGNYSGEWKSIADSLLNINVGYWGGRMNYKLQIVSLSESELKVKYLHQ